MRCWRLKGRHNVCAAARHVLAYIKRVRVLQEGGTVVLELNADVQAGRMLLPLNTHTET